MIVKLNYADFDKNSKSVELYKNEKYETAYMILRVDMENVLDAIEIAKSNRWVVGLEYSGDLAFLADKDLKGVNIFFNFAVNDFDATALQNIEYGFSTTPKSVRIVLNTSPNFSDMRVVKGICKRFENASFNGGNFIRLEGCKFGEIMNEDLPKKVPESKIGYLCSGDCNILPTCDISEYDYAWGNIECPISKVKEPKEKVAKTSKEPKAPKEPKESKAKKEKAPPKKKGASYAVSGGLASF